MDIATIQNSLGLWICAAIMIAIILVQAVLYMRICKTEANRLGITEEKQKETRRSAAITCLGPALALSVMLLTLMTTFGAPTAWMRMNDVGSGRTELAIATMVGDLVTAEKGTAEWDLQNFSYGVWAQGIDVAGWIVGAMIAVILGGRLTKTLNEKFDAKWIKVLMGSCLVSLFSYLLINQVYGKKAPVYLAAALGGLTMFLLNKIFRKNKRMQEFSLGISIVVGAVFTQLIMG